MRVSNIVAVALAGFSGLSSAWIDSFLVNESTKPGDDVTLILEGHNYNQAVGEVSATFGLAPDDSTGSKIETVLSTVSTAGMCGRRVGCDSSIHFISSED